MECCSRPKLDIDFMIKVVGEKAVRHVMTLSDGTVKGFITGHSMNKITRAFKKEAEKNYCSYIIKDHRCLFHRHRPDEMIYISVKNKKI